MQKFVNYLEIFSVVQAAVLLFLVPSLYAPRSLKIAILILRGTPATAKLGGEGDRSAD